MSYLQEKIKHELEYHSFAVLPIFHFRPRAEYIPFPSVWRGSTEYRWKYSIYFYISSLPRGFHILSLHPGFHNSPLPWIFLYIISTPGFYISSLPRGSYISSLTKGFQYHLYPGVFKYHPYPEASIYHLYPVVFIFHRHISSGLFIMIHLFVLDD